MDNRIKDTARDIVEKLSPIPDEVEDEVDAENREFMTKAIPMMLAASKKWREEHGPNEHCDVRVVRGEDGELTVKVTPNGEGYDH